MAKGSAMGLWKGKKGSSVFYKITNSNNGQKQGIRERAYEVSNPQTAAQADQRMKLLPAQRIAGALREIVERGWQGIDYGAKSRSAYLSQALKKSSGFPYLNKGDDRIVPGTYQLSKGTISPVICTHRFEDEFYDLVTDIQLDAFPEEQTDTWGDAVSTILSLSPTLKEGDQLTFVYALAPLSAVTDENVTEAYDEITFTWGYFSVYLDPNDDTNWNDFRSFGSVQLSNYSEGSSNCLSVISDTAGYVVVAGTCIISRDNGNGGYLRSTQKLVMADAIPNIFETALRKATAQQSYMKSESTQNSDWPVDTDAEGGESSSYLDEFIALSGLTGAAASANGTQFRIKRRVNDNVITGVYYVQSVQAGDCVVGTNGQPVTYSDQMEVVGVSPTMAKNAMPILANAQTIFYRP